MEYIVEKQIAQIQQIIGSEPAAFAMVRGSSDYPSICGMVYFFSHEDGVIVMADIYRLPVSDHLKCGGSLFGFHIHEAGDCSGDSSDPFKNVGGHYNPGQCFHPYHAGDLPPLYGTRSGRSFSVFLTDRFTIEEVIHRAVVIHDKPDDFTSQPSGNSGVKIACGTILKW